MCVGKNYNYIDYCGMLGHYELFESYKLAMLRATEVLKACKLLKANVLLRASEVPK